jgi:hypothetical protein
MGIPFVGGVEQAKNVATASHGAAGAAESGFRPKGGTPFNLHITGSFVASVALERSMDAGANWAPCSIDGSGTPSNFTVRTSVMVMELEDGVIYRTNCTAWTSGTVNVRLSQ